MIMSSSKLIQKRDKNYQSGFVSIIVAALIMVLVSLITIGFTKAMQREQRQTIDRQLSRQALYAAESNINDVVAALRNDPNLPAQKTDCDVSSSPSVNNGVLETNDVAYTCVIYDKTPTELDYKLGTDESNVTLLRTASGNNFNSISVMWSQADGNNQISNLPNCSNINTENVASRNGVPLIRFDLTDISALRRDDLINKTDNMYLYPCQGGGGTNSTAYNSVTKGRLIPVECVDATVSCTLEITGLGSSNSYSLRMRSVYDEAYLSIIAVDTFNNTVEFKQSQTSIDVTARAQDVVRRLRVSLPLEIAENPPEGVIQSFNGVCKLLRVDTSPGSTDPIENNCP